jgi:hypothetical protein
MFEHFSREESKASLLGIAKESGERDPRISKKIVITTSNLTVKGAFENEMHLRLKLLLVANLASPTQVWDVMIGLYLESVGAHPKLT